MTTVTLKIPSLKDEQVADVVKTAVQRLKGVKDVRVEIPTHNVTVDYDDSQNGTTLTAIQVALQLARHPHGQFAAGQKRRGWV